MQTALLQTLLTTPAGREADEVLRNCVHCGFCNATCPTYQLTGDELDGPRGRIYLIKQVLEGRPATARTQLHLDRCLTCRACETTCPSGVEYHHLLDTGRELIERQVGRTPGGHLLRRVLRLILTRRRTFAVLLRMGQALRPLLPRGVQRQVPARPPRLPAVSGGNHRRRMLLLEGCVQPALAPQINHATRRVLDALGITVVSATGSGCCGAVSHHLGAVDEARQFMRNNIDAWWPEIRVGAEAIVITASGCAPLVKEYGRLLAEDSVYAEKAARVSALARDLSEVVTQEPLDERLRPNAGARKIAFHSPCTLQHAQKLDGVVEDLLARAGFELTAVAGKHLCCGSAGTYSLLQPALARELRDNKLEALQAGEPEVIATANIGCLMHLAGTSRIPVRHWIELLEPCLARHHEHKPTQVAD
jgi:glycolate dehydrogenase iron-sulfur subunit